MSSISKRLLQVIVAVLATIPIVAGGMGIILGPSFLGGIVAFPLDLDSHFRFLSGVFLAVGLTFYATIPSIERSTLLFRFAAALIIIGGIGRLVSLLAIGAPSLGHVGGLCLELIVVPLLALWQGRLAAAARNQASAFAHSK